jgi:plastocyanin
MNLFFRNRYVTVALMLALLLSLSGPLLAATHTVEMSGFRFVPKDITIDAGDTVTWVNQDLANHDTTSGTNGIPSGLWRSPFLGNNGTFSFVFNVPPGRYAYYCTPHVSTFSMFGSITVVGPNVPPSVTIGSPANGATFAAGDNILIEAAASDPENALERVDFFVNGNLLGSAASAPYSFVFNNAGPGNHTLSAIAVDEQGATSPPAVVSIAVQAGNLPPAITITNPISGQTFFVGTHLLVEAAASDPDGVSQVEFFLDAASVGVRTVAPFSVLLTNVSLGEHSLSAVATDRLGASAPSQTIRIFLVNAPVAPEIIDSPQSQTVAVGSLVMLSVNASGTDPRTFRWLFNGSFIPNATNATLVLSNVQPAQSGSYSVIVSNAFGTATSTAATLLVNASPTIVIISPTADQLLLGESVTIDVEVVDPDPTGLISRVEFFLSPALGVTNVAAVVTNEPFSAVLSNLVSGAYVLTARATDNQGGATTASPVQFFVRNRPVLTRSPANAVLPLGGKVTLTALIDSTTAGVTNVEFFAGAKVGSDAAPPYRADWQPSQTGEFTLFAVAAYEFGPASTSAPISLRIEVGENTRPTLVITSSPPNFERRELERVTLSGIATDNRELTQIEYQLGVGEWQPLLINIGSATAVWTLSIDLVAGFNTVRVRSRDWASNLSFVGTRYFTLLRHDRLNLDVQEGGSVTPDLNTQYHDKLEIGKAYTLIARANKGYLFNGWEGVSNASGAVLNFQMTHDLRLMAKFVTNRFPQVAGTYSGLFSDRHELSPNTSGMVTLQLAKSGMVTGKLRITDKTYPLRGQFDPLGFVNFQVLRRGMHLVVLALQVDFDRSSIHGDVSQALGTNQMLVVSELMAERKAAVSSVQTARFGLRFTGTHVDVGSGLASIGKNGSVQIRGELDDGSGFQFAGVLSDQRAIAWYLPLRQGTELILGWMEVGTEPGLLTGTLFWLKPGSDSMQIDIISKPL